MTLTAIPASRAAPSGLRFCAPFGFLAVTALGLALGGPWAFLTFGVTPLALVGLDWGLGGEVDTAGLADHPGLRILPHLYIALQIAVTLWAALSPGTSLVQTVGATVSVGVCGGVFGMLCAHELIHKNNPTDRLVGLGMLAVFGYMQFAIAHVHGHHVRAATVEDPASARRGEGAYAFLVRSIAGQTREAWRFEAERLRRRGRPVLGPQNRLLGYLGVEVAVADGFALLGWRAFAVWAGQAVLSVLLLELFNYIAHYGLQRRRRADGSLERLAPRHSWNSRRRMNNASLFNMGRHADHHRRPAQPYYGLEATPDAPELPTGYAGAILLALIPPLWRRVMGPRVDVWMRPDPGSEPCA